MGSITSKLRDMEEDLSDGGAYSAKIELLKKIRAGNRVKRFHTVDLLVGETVGHHSANVAMLCLVLSTGTPRAELLAAALTHDLVEQYTGDIPATAKWASVELSKAITAMEDKYALFNHDLTSLELQILKQADMLDLCYKILEEVQMGNTLVHPILLRGIRYLREHDPLPITKYLIKEIEHAIR